MQFKSSVILALSFGSYALASTTQDVLNGLSTLTSAWTTLQTDVKNLPATVTLNQALAISADVSNLEADLSTLTTTVKGLPGRLSENDGVTVFLANNQITTLGISALNLTITKKPSFDTVPVAGFDALFAQGVTALDQSNTNFENALLAVLPADLQSSETTENTLLHNAFERVIAVYGA